VNLTVEELVDDPAIATFLERDRLWTAYGLCDLEQPYRRHARYAGALRDGQIVAIVLVYAPPGFNGMLPFGDEAGVAAILTTVRELPSQPFLLMGDEHADIVRRWYRLTESWQMLRMAVRAANFLTRASSQHAVRMSVSDRPAMEDLHGVERDSAFFDPATIAHGLYFGVYEQAKLVAIAGTHAWSRRYRIGTVGGVFTHPEHRGKGLAQVTTGAVTKALFDAGVEDVILNVRADNVPALQCYSRLGYTTVRPYLEAQAVERSRSPGKLGA
jgi:RimJ/RimL family protein N-acetyltransferase